MTQQEDKPSLESRARYMYLADTSNESIHCNRFPGWSELSEANRAEYIERARRAIAYEQ